MFGSILLLQVSNLFQAFKKYLLNGIMNLWMIPSFRNLILLIARNIRITYDDLLKF